MVCQYKVILNCKGIKQMREVPKMEERHNRLNKRNSAVLLEKQSSDPPKHILHCQP